MQLSTDLIDQTTNWLLTTRDCYSTPVFAMNDNNDDNRKQIRFQYEVLSWMNDIIISMSEVEARYFH